jgi:hypothetical protein
METISYKRSPSQVCLWCCHPGLPESMWTHGLIDGKFCSYECKLAYKLSDPLQSSQVKGEYFRLFGCDLKPAPSRMVLRLFGGPLTIHQFRTTKISKVSVSEDDSTIVLSFP